MLQSWRWFGPNDVVNLRDIQQAGAKGVVSSLHHLPCGSYWSESDIQARIDVIAWDALAKRPSGMHWHVVESLPIHEDIKTRSGNYKEHIARYKENIRNLGACNVKIICYNFIPVLDWARTDLNIEQNDGSTVSGCNIHAFIAFDLFILKRPHAAADYSVEDVMAAEKFFAALNSKAKTALEQTIMLGLPGTVDGLTVEQMLAMIERYRHMDRERLSQNLYAFLNDIMPVCEQYDVKMSIHPDDPAYPIFGIPRILSTAEDVARLFAAVPSRQSGLTMCTGSFGSCSSNDPAQMLERFAQRVYFVHFRNVTHAPGQTGTFYESNHLFGSVDMPRAMRALIVEEERRKNAGMSEWQIPVRPDHGKLLDCDKDSGAYPGYSRTGRMIGLAELRGLEVGLRYAMGLNLQ